MERLTPSTTRYNRYPDADASSYQRKNLTLDTLKDFQSAQNWVVENARGNPAEGCWNCGEMGHHDTTCRETQYGRKLNRDIEELDRKKDRTIGRPDLLLRDD